MRNHIAWLLPSVLVVGLFAGTALAQGDTINACINPNGLTFIVDDVGECGQNDTILNWGTGGSATTFRIVEQTFPMEGTDTGQYLTYAAFCVAGEQVINGGLYWNDISMRTIDASRGFIRNGRFAGNTWEEVMLDAATASEVHLWSTFTVYAVCAS